MATREIAETVARKAAREHQRPMHVVNDPSAHDQPIAVAYYAADDETLETFYAGLEPLVTFGPDGRSNLDVHTGT